MGVVAEAATRQRLADLTVRRQRLEALLAEHRPDLRRGEALWVVFDASARIDVSESPRGFTQLKRMQAVQGANYAAVRIVGPDDSNLGTVRLSHPVKGLLAAAAHLRRFAGVILAVAMSLSLFFSWLAAFWFMRPLQRVTEAAKSLGGGDLSARATVRGDDEVGDAARALDTMAVDLRGR